MHYTVYIDVLFLVNFFMDIWILWLMKTVLKYRSSVLRILLAAFIGALWVCLITAFSFLPKVAENVITYFGISSAMICIAFHKRNWKELLKGIVALYVVSFCLGGISNYLFYHTKAGSLPRLFMLLTFSVGCTFILLSEFISSKKSTKDIYSVKLCYQGRNIELKGLWDSGNSLSDPLTHKPVCIVEYPAVKDLVTSIEGFRYIPFQSVGKTDGLLVGIEMDQLVVQMEKEQIQIESPMIGICKHSLSRDNRYQMLLHPLLMERE